MFVDLFVGYDISIMNIVNISGLITTPPNDTPTIYSYYVL